MLTITPRADTYISNCGIEFIRFGVKPNKGCAGFEYIWESSQSNKDDYVINVNDRYTLLINKYQKKYLDMCQIDLKDVDDNTGYKIQFNNEKVEVQCGCGESLDFADNISEDPKEVWEPRMTWRFFHDENNPWLQPHTVNEDGVAEIKFPNSNIDSLIREAGDSIRESAGFKPTKKKEKQNLSNKYKLWREAD